MMINNVLIDYAAAVYREIPDIGDNGAMIFWILIIALALGGVITSVIMLVGNKNEKRSKAHKDKRGEDHE